MVSAVSGKSGVKQPPAIVRVFNRAKSFLTDVWVELKKARWPTREELAKFTAVVIVAVIAVAVFIAVIDTILTWLTQSLGIFPKG